MPASAVVGNALVVMVTFDVEDVHGGLLIDHVNIVMPGVNPVSVELGKREFVITPGPETMLHAPVPTVAVLPAKVKEPVLAQIVWLGPAVAMDGTARPTITILSDVLAQGALAVVH